MAIIYFLLTGAVDGLCNCLPCLGVVW